MAEPHEAEQGGQAEGDLRRMFQATHGETDQVEAERHGRRHQREVGRRHRPQPDPAFGGDQAEQHRRAGIGRKAEDQAGRRAEGQGGQQREQEGVEDRGTRRGRLTRVEAVVPCRIWSAIAMWM
ncbi:hypothetical protein [Dankookia sp. P2]|uniref:hypothetical protein n=1 Tax=Dankookia sp. P2 TaxID=3423955 RepID=UPI003D667669